MPVVMGCLRYSILTIILIIYWDVWVHSAATINVDQQNFMERRDANTAHHCGEEKRCLCYSNHFVDCKDKSLRTVPRHLPNDTVSLDMSVNKITELGKLSFITYPLLEVLNVSNNAITFVGAETFGELRNLITLDLHWCDISKVEKMTFAGLKSLRYLDMSDNNNLTFKSLRNISFGLTFTKIQTLKLNNIHAKYGSCTVLTKNEMEFLNKTRLTDWQIDSNRLAIFETAAVDYIPRTVESFSAKNNIAMLGDFLFYMFFHNPFINLRRLILSGQGQTEFFDLLSNMLQQEHTHIPATDDNPRAAPAKYDSNRKVFDGHVLTDELNLLNITYVDISNCNFKRTIGHIKLKTPNNLTHLIANNDILWKWKGPMEGFEKLTFLDLSVNYCENISDYFFENMTNLMHLNLSNNFAGFSLETDKNGKTFRAQSKLQNLDLANNKIRHMPENIFCGMSDLRILNLSRNQLFEFCINLDHLNKLKYLTLSDNMLDTIPESIRDTFDHLKNFTLNIQRNRFRCSCNTTYTDFLYWLIHTRVRFENLSEITECVFDNGTTVAFMDRHDIQKVYDELLAECSSHWLLIICVVSLSVLIVSLVLSALIYRFRWNLRYFYYMAKFKYKGYRRVEHESTEYNNDVFVSYADEDRGFVRQKILEKLEKERNFSLLVHDRDFLAGEFVGDNIIRAITESRKTLIVMTKDFLKSEWCMYELNMARMESIQRGENVICVLLKEYIPAKMMPVEILDVMKKQTYIEYPEEVHLRDSFWDRLVFSLSEA